MYLFWVQCNLQASNQRGSRSAIKTQRLLAGRVSCAAHCSHREPQLHRDVFSANQLRLLQQSPAQTRFPLPADQTPAPHCGGWFPILCVPEPQFGSDRRPERPPRCRRRPGPKCCGDSSQLPWHRRQHRRRHQQPRQLKDRQQLATMPGSPPMPQRATTPTAGHSPFSPFPVTFGQKDKVLIGTTDFILPDSNFSPATAGGTVPQNSSFWITLLLDSQKRRLKCWF